MHSVPRTDRNEIRHSRMTAPKTQTMIGHCAAATASLVAAITPTLPVASLNDTSGLPCSASNCFTAATISLDRLGLVVAGEQHDRHHAAVGVQQPARRRHVGHRLGQHRLVAREHAPLRRAFVPAGVQRLREPGQIHGGLHARQVPHVPGEVVDRRHHGVVDAPLRLRLDDHVQDVDADRELRRDHGRVDVVARVGAQLGHAPVEVADLHLAALPRAEDAEHDRQRHDDDRRAPRRHAREAAPERRHRRAARCRRSG